MVKEDMQEVGAREDQVFDRSVYGKSNVTTLYVKNRKKKKNYVIFAI